MATFSVIITTHKRPELLARSIGSVKAGHPPPAEIVVVSDHPCPSTYAVVSALLSDSDLFIQRSGEPGPAASRNAGMRAASGDYIIFLDDDDALTSTFLAETLAFLDPSIVLNTDYYTILERSVGGVTAPVSGEHHCLAQCSIDAIHIKNFIPAACFVYPRAALAGRAFDPAIGYEDWDFILNVMAQFKLSYIPVNGPIIYSRETPDNRGSQNNNDLERIYRSVYRKWPAPNEERRADRRDLLASCGISVAVETL